MTVGLGQHGFLSVPAGGRQTVRPAVVIGGARVTGGVGLYAGTLAGALFLSTLSTAITVLSLSQGLRSIIQGGVIILALLLQSRQGSRRTN